MARPHRPPEGDPPEQDALPEALRAVPGGESTAERVLAELADVQVAQEELRVAEEEMRVQQEQISHLLLQHDAERRWRGHMSALVPVGLCVTDGYGTLLEANPALAAHLGTGLHRLRGKPLSVFLAREDVKEFRTALRALGTGTATEHRMSVTVRPRRLPPAAGQIFGFPESTDHRASVARIHWVLVSDPFTGEGLGAGPEPGPAEDTPPTPEEPIPADDVIGLAGALAELTTLPVSELDRQRLLTRMATLVRAAVPSADWVSITIGSPLEPQRLGSDSVEAQQLDGWQTQAAQGPCVDAFTQGSVVVTEDVTADPRWPALAALARRGAVRSVLAVPVREDGAITGQVNLYSGKRAAFGPASRRIGELATAAVAGILQNVAERESMQSLAEHLERALTSRAVIDQAKGMIMAKLGVDAEDAFARLVQVSSRLNVKVRDLAALVVEGHVDTVLRAGE